MTHILANESRFPFWGAQTIPNTEKARKSRRDITDVCLTSCFLFVMNKSSPQVTIGLPAPGEELAAVQMHRAAMVSQA